MGRYEEALQSGRHASELLPFFKGFKEEQEYYFIYSLTLLAVCNRKRLLFSSSEKRETGEPLPDKKDLEFPNHDFDQDQLREPPTVMRHQCSEEHLQLIALVIENLKQFKPVCDEAPTNYRHQYLIVESELERAR